MIMYVKCKVYSRCSMVVANIINNMNSLVYFLYGACFQKQVCRLLGIPPDSFSRFLRLKLFSS